ncbi:Chondroitin sulfate proteoglycan 4 Chondroitin sulfate proteoglycan NG2 Proteoglycan AN2 Precursor [Larimichthys crocea]|uniref:Chondroitin sulfate proteoglycan 4 Chondroitin sulfate proteoglycan NG2 Proteoglycan AN2 n=1 Tax=Larimichthys crocea TaxID=215358 RepID=A0A6G0HD41_LARCR|nr:Chondroitin sulfate proteoglycan 4 Chondroitin sulfate proteoglycan NG2 Proteoglycan AN2 Precursor [Larimichthys crocea]
MPGKLRRESYFGDSYCSIQAFQDVSTFQLSLRIKTSRRSGLLLLAAGMEDYLFLELQNGKVQARMNMGAGEVTLTSSQGVQLNNLLDHKISLTLQDDKLTMTVDDLFPTYVPVNDDGEELNIDQGIWLGGTGDLDTPYLSNAIPPFRGCMTQVKFESHQFDILSTAFKQCHDTKESCSSEFEAGDGEATSFSTPDSFVSFPTWSGVSGAPRVLEVLMKTTIEDALLVFHPGRESDFIAVGVVKGYVKGMLDLGNGVKVLDNTQVQLDDDQWHRVKVQVGPESFVINVDSQSSSLPLDSSQKLDLVGNLYLGGIQGKMKDVFRESGSLNHVEDIMTAESFIGCLGEIKVNQKDRSLLDALVTKDVHVKCEGEDYDYSSYYDVDATTSPTSPPVRIRYVDMDFNEQHCNPTDDTPEIFRNASEEQTIGVAELQAEVNGKNPDPQTIKYILIKPPTLGSLQLFDRELAEGDIFTQKDISDSNLSYKIRVQRAVDSIDQFQFRVFADDQYSPLYTFPINILANADAPVLTNENLVVLQGGEHTINKNYLWMQSPGHMDFVYQVTKEPKYGRLIRDSPPGQPRFEGAIRVFSNEDLQLDRLIYKHDGSKTSSDEFHFSTSDQAAESTNQQTVNGIFRISIKSKNEHAPVRVVDKVFNVVRHGQRLLTTDVIQFKDEDSGFNDTQIVYAREGILSGNIVSTSNPSQPLFRFTQADLRDKKILFIHHGADRERFSLQVSDGFHKTTTLLQIQASEPYLRVVNNTIIVIDHGSTKTLNTTLLSANSNMDIRDDSEIKFQVTSPPSDGRIIVSGIEASVFTQKDLKKGVVSYEHNYESLRSKDSFSFTVQARGHSDEGTFRIKIFKQGYLSEPEVRTNEVIISYQGEHTIINQDNLKVEQADILPTEMVFTVKEPPRLGHVVKLTNSSDSTASPVLDYIHSFTQEDIDQGRILYVSASTQGNDGFTVDVSNGFTTVEDLHISVNIVPRLIPLQTFNFTVKEGLSRAITTDVINIVHPFYTSANIEFVVEESPQHGDLRYLDGDELNYFTWDEMKLGHIYYMHDSTETTEDSFTLSASAYEIERRSLPVTISVTVIPVNDEPPKLTRNTGLEVLAGEEADITSSMLNTDDADTRAEELVYHVELLTSGIVALKESPEDEVLNFTQAQINKGEVIFIHEGEESGGFSFTVTDGEHTSPLYRFVVTARPLTITMVTQEELMVFPGTRKPITSANLGAVTNEDGNEISYSLIRPPRYGRLILANDRNQYEEITSFSQTQLESGAVFYEHQIPDWPFWVARDSIGLTLSSQPAPDVHHILPITISFYAAHSNISSQLWKNKGLEIVQGQRKVIDDSILDASNLLASLPEDQRDDVDVVFEIKHFPDHGRITLAGQDLPRNAPSFTQEDLTQGIVEYLHDDSGAPTDNLSFRVRLKSEGRSVASPAESVILEEVFNISVKRRGSEPPELVTVDMLLEVFQGSMTILTKKHLNTQDEDSPPDEVHFKVTKAPSNGRLVDSFIKDPISEFTQEMINRGQVGFYSDGSLADGFIEFIISDGEHQTEPHTLHVGVLARTLLLDKAPEIKVKQGDDETLVTEEMLRATTGGPVEEDILYKITSVPKYAAVMVDRQPTSAFTQKQIKEGRVSVRFVKSTSPRDSVAFVARSRAANVSSVLNITVQPLANIAQDPLLPQGSLVQLDRKLLDATPLANKTRTSPTFTVIQQPRGARFVRYGSPGAGQPVDTFSQKDLDEGRVAMEILNSSSGSRDGVTQDEARFLLKAHGVPPAECVLSFQTGPYNASGIYPAKMLRIPPKDSNELPGVGGSPRATPASPHWKGNMDWPHGDAPTTTSSGSGSHGKPHVSRRSNFWSILIPIMVILLLLLLAAILAYYLIRKNKTGKHDVQTAATKPKNGEVASTETFRKTDPVNNIPMSNMDSKDTDPELLQHCRTTNPALKKNQYWV